MAECTPTPRGGDPLDLARYFLRGRKANCGCDQCALARALIEAHETIARLREAGDALFHAAWNEPSRLAEATGEWAIARKEARDA